MEEQQMPPSYKK